MKKMLSNLLELPAKIDEDIHRSYSKLTKKWEDKGKDKRVLSLILDGLTVSSIFALPTNNHLPGIGYVYGISLGESTTSFKYSKEENNKNGLVYHPVKYLVNNFGRIIRMPELMVGGALIIKGLVDLGNYFINNDSSSFSDGLNNLSVGVPMVSNASAWYVRDSDPKVLDEKPNWKAGLEKLIDYFSPAQTEPSPIKIPVKY